MENKSTDHQTKVSEKSKHVSSSKNKTKPLTSESAKNKRIFKNSAESSRKAKSTSPSTPLSRLKQKQLNEYCKKVCKKKLALKNETKSRMYFEEKLRKKRSREYIRELNEALKRRILWKQFQKELKEDVKRSFIRSSGPEWWQEPSRNQIFLATCLGDVIKADEEEGVTIRTRQLLLDLGVVTRISPKQVRFCTKRSLLNPVDFLLEVHDLVVTIQKNEKKKKGQLEKPFSVDERILLSAVCVLQLPTLLTMLHHILPPPKFTSESTYVQEQLYGDLNDESIRYATPYMEPLPFRNQDDFKAWAFDRVYKALLPSVIESIPKDRVNENVTVQEISTTPMTPQVFSNIIPVLNGSRESFSRFSSTPTVCWLLSHCVSNRRHQTSSLITNFRANSQDTSESSRKSFSRRLSTKLKRSLQSRRVNNEENINLDNYLSSDLDYYKHQGQHDKRNLGNISPKLEQPTDLVDHHQDQQEGGSINEFTRNLVSTSPKLQQTTDVDYQGFQQQHDGSINSFNLDSRPTLPKLEQNTDLDYQKFQYQQEYGPKNISNLDRKLPNLEQNADLDYQEYQNQKNIGSINKVNLDNSSPNQPRVSKVLNIECNEKLKVSPNKLKPKTKPNDSILNKLGLHHVWDEIKELKKDEQLQHAITILADMGDPLAQLPKVYKLPSVQRWFELRQGKRRILTKEEKQELLTDSRGMWRSNLVRSMKEIPKIKCSKKQERLLTWDKKEWLTTEINKELNSYYTRVRTEKVDNARAFFPTMLNHYDHGSKLNRNFRDVYFTYLPAREADLKVLRPWKLNEVMGFKD